MKTTLRRIAALALATPLVLTAPMLAHADEPGAGVGPGDVTTGPGSASNPLSTAHRSHQPSASAATQQLTSVVAPAPRYEETTDRITIPSVKGVTYLDSDGMILEAGSYGYGDFGTEDMNFIQAIPAAGYELTGAPWWRFTTKEEISTTSRGNRVVTRPVTAPTVAFDVTERTYTLPESSSTVYSVSPTWDPGTADGFSDVPGTHTLPSDADSAVVSQRLSDALSGQDGAALVGAEVSGMGYYSIRGFRLIAPTFDTARGTYTIPEDPYIDYFVNGTRTAAGTYSHEGTVTITFEFSAAADRTVAYSWDATSWTETLSTPSPFTDVKPGVEHYDHMVWMQTSGISTGWKTRTGYEYRPLSPVNRDAMAAFLYRMAGSPEVTLPKTSPFKDVRPGQEHYTAIIWAHQQGITTGWKTRSGTEFRPTTPINRDAMAAFLYRFAGSPAYTMPTGTCFTDVKPTQQFAKEMCWMKDAGISTGWPTKTGPRYRPLQSVKRDAMAAFLHRYHNTH